MDTEEFKTFLSPLYRRMYATAYSVLGDADEAADAVQDSVMRLYEIRRRLSGPGGIARPDSFALSVVRNRALDRVRELSGRHTAPLSEAEKYESGDVVADDSSGDADRIRRLMAELPQRQREVLQLTAVGGMTPRDVAEEMNISEVNVRQLLFRARRRMRELFAKEL